MALAAPVSAQVGTGRAQAYVLEPLSLLNTRGLDFGIITAGPTAGTVTIDPATEARTVTGGVVPLGGSVSAAEFLGAGAAKSKIAIIKEPRASITLTRSGGTETMTVDTFMVEGGNGTSRQLGNDGTLRFRVGARLNVGANQAQGTYLGTFNVTVDYN